MFADSALSAFHLALSGQILREYLVVATRGTEQNGLGMSVADALSNVERFRGRALFCDEGEVAASRLRQLVAEHGLVGKRIHDGNVVATMQPHGVSKLITENPRGFAGFGGVELVDLPGAAALASASRRPPYAPRLLSSSSKVDGSRPRSLT
jgi:predicted nucleic acid-binding protein